jgi:hypothetical protein
MMNQRGRVDIYKIIFFSLIAIILIFGIIALAWKFWPNESNLSSSSNNCDINKDGLVDAKEQAICGTATTKPSTNDKTSQGKPTQDQAKPNPETTQIPSGNLTELSSEAGLHFILTKNGDNYLISSGILPRLASSMQTSHGNSESWAPLIWPTEAPILNEDVISLKVKNFGFVTASNVRIIIDEQTNNLNVQNSAISDANLASGEEATLTFEVQTTGAEKHVLMYHLEADYGGKTFTFGNGKKQIIFISSRDEDNWKVFSVKPDGTDLTALTRLSEVGWCDFPSPGYDESKISFDCHGVDGSEQIYIHLANPDGSNLQTIIFPETDTGSHNRPAFSPTRNMLALSGTGKVYSISGLNAEYFFDAGGMPSFSPDGSMIVYGKDDGTYIVDTDGQNRRKISSNSGDVFCWSPDGEYILHGNRVVKSDGSEEFTVPVASNSCWSPGGSLIVSVRENPRRELYLTRKDGTAEAQLTTTLPSNAGIDCNAAAKTLGTCARNCCTYSNPCRDCAPFHNEWAHGDWVPNWYGK